MVSRIHSGLLAAVSARAEGRAALSETDALALAEVHPEVFEELLTAARTTRDRVWGTRATFSPKVFLPLTNLCRNRCDYCSFRKSAGQPGEWTMTRNEVTAWLDQGRAQGCVEALFCLGDKPEGTFASYRKLLAGWGFASTVDYLMWSGRQALERGLLPHTNAGVLTRDEMHRLKDVNVSLGLMLENISPRLCEPGMPHHKAPDKRPEKRMRMMREAGELKIPFTTGILIGIGETARERMASLLAIRQLHREYGHIQEVIVQNFRARPEIPMHEAPEPEDAEMLATVAAARLILDDDISLQAPPNLNPGATERLLAAGLNDFGGISPVTPDYINPRHPWPHLRMLSEACEHSGFELRPRAPIYDSYVRRPGFLHPDLHTLTAAANQRLAEVKHAGDLARTALDSVGRSENAAPDTFAEHT